MLLDHNGGLTSEALQEQADAFEPFDHERFLNHVCADHLPHWLIVDVSNCPSHVKDLYPTWLNRNVHLITANINVAAASTTLHHLIRTKLREKKLIFDSEACLAIGVPIFNTIQNFIQTGDDIQTVEYSGSRFLNSVLNVACAAPSAADVNLPALLKQHIDEYKSLMSVREMLDDVMGVRSAKKAVLLARELGFQTELHDVDIQSCWRYRDNEDDENDDVSKWDYEQLLAHLVSKCEPLQQQITQTIANRAETPSLRLMAFVDATTGTISVRVEALASAHAFASLQPLQGAFAFYTTRHAAHPVVVTGPIADSSITAGTLFGSILNLARNCGAREGN
uniref:homoserine dehydrogenase n=1 Tax=Globisporangium ultimum (strain ATCC 200006 / CBS 805.95 / DAOM BR144) TaxID=431595 RepID=K3XA40_GLOUD